MKANDFLLALVVAAIWGANFVAIRVGLDGMPPLLLCAVRFFFAAFPAVFFIPRPRIAWKILLGYGLTYFAVQFGLLFSAMYVGFSAGLASLVLQTQVFFTAALAIVFYADRCDFWKIGGALVSFSGLAVVAAYSTGEVTPLGLALVLLAAFSFACGNMVSRQIGQADPLALVVWGSLIAFPLLTVLSLAVEGPAAIGNALDRLSWASVGAVAYIVYLSTHLGFSMWSTLLVRHPATTIAPFTLLVPVFGFLSSALFLSEPIYLWKVIAAFLVVSGIGLSLLGNRRRDAPATFSAEK